jgi:predicted acyltransferase
MQTVARPAPQRVLSVDVLRGLTIALMILVNDPGDWGHVYAQLDHAEWNGFTLTDFVFPNFLFLVGASIVFSIESRMAKGDCKRSLAFHMFRRAVTIFAIKMFLSAFPHFHLTHLRIFGVLTRIAVCYLIAGLICLAVWNVHRRIRTLLAITAILLIGYWALMRFVPVPGFGVPTHAMPILDPDRNLAAWLDRGFNAFTRRWLHTGSLYNHTRDPEGLLSTIPAVATTLIGCITGLWLRDRVPHVRRISPDVGLVASAAPTHPNEGSSQPDPARAERVEGVVEAPPHLDHGGPANGLRRFGGLYPASVLLCMMGVLWNDTFPINKNLWTSSYVLYSVGWSLFLLALCNWLIDTRHLNEKPVGKALLFPWLVFGSNAIAAYVLSNLFVEIALWIKVPAGALVNPADPTQRISAWLWTYRHIFARHDSTNVTSVAFALAFTALCFLPNWLLWRRKIFLKI